MKRWLDESGCRGWNDGDTGPRSGSQTSSRVGSRDNIHHKRLSQSGLSILIALLFNAIKLD